MTIVTMLCILLAVLGLYMTPGRLSRWMRIRDMLHARAMRESRLEIGRQIANCAKCVRHTDDAALMVLAMSELLRSGFAVTGPQLKAEYERLKEVEK